MIHFDLQPLTSLENVSCDVTNVIKRELGSGSWKIRRKEAHYEKALPFKTVSAFCTPTYKYKPSLIHFYINLGLNL